MIRSTLTKRIFTQPPGPNYSCALTACRIASQKQFPIANGLGRRAFSASAARRIATESDSVITNYVGVKFLDLIHATGLPWYATIPIAALLVRGALSYPTFSGAERARQMRYRRMLPIYTAQAAVYKMGGIPITDLMKQRRKLLYNDRYLDMVPWNGIANISVLLVMAEAIRSKIGSPSGLVGLLMSPFTWAFNKVAPGWMSQQQDSQGQDMETPSSHDASAAAPAELSGPSTQVSPQDSLEGAGALNSTSVDPTLWTEGLWWCPDLTMADPTANLPLLVLVLQFGRTLLTLPVQDREAKAIETALEQDPERRRALARQAISQDVLRSRASHLFMGFTLSYGFYTFVSLHCPTAILLYIFASTAVGIVERIYSKSALTYPRAITPCRRPLKLRGPVSILL